MKAVPYKIAVYAIAKNEEKFADRWAKSMSEADEIVVLDTGSEDNTVKILSSYPNIRVYSEKIVPWRFDTARNRALELVSLDADICISTDLDELFEPGWRDGIEKALDKGARRIRYRYTWNFLPDGREGTVFIADKFHARHGFVWKHPVHEVITYTGEGEPKTVFAENVRLLHKADNAKSREAYLGLLELSVRECPEDDRNMHYLGREYMFRKRYSEAVETLKKHLSLKNATWADERSASMRYIAFCSYMTGDGKAAEQWYLRSCAEAPHLREPWLNFAYFCYETEKYEAAAALVERALEIKTRQETYMNESDSWNEKPYDVLSMSYYYLGDMKRAREAAEKALAVAPENERIRKNLSYFC